MQNKKQFKEYIKSTLTRIVGILIPVLILFIYLIITASLVDFVNYAILGIQDFSNKINYTELFQNEKIEIKIFAIIVPLTLGIMAITIILSQILKKENYKIQNILTLLLYSFSVIIVMYPISDEIHFLIGSIITIISLIYLIFLVGELIYNKISYKKKKKIFKILSLIIWLAILILILNKTANNIYNYAKVQKNTEIKHFKNIEIKEYLKNRIDEIDKFIEEQESQGKKVYILDSEAVVYMVPLDKYNKDYDMFLKGNIGKNGEENQIEKIKQRDENTIYLIRNKEMQLNWQTPLNVISYIRENLENIGEINMYEIYK